jgi:tetratricopeptide (TPR) repeat protein
LSESKKDFDFLFLFLALGFAISSFLVSLLFNFSFVSGEIYFFALVSVLSAMSVSYLQTDYFKTEKKQERISTKKGFRIFLFFVFSASILFLFSYEFSVFKADNYFYKTNYYLKRGEYLLAVESFSKIEELCINPLNINYYQRFIAENLSEHYLNNDKKEMDVLAKEFLSSVPSRFFKDGFNNLVVAGKIEAALGREDSARLLWQEAANLSPYWPRTYMEIARSFRRSNLWTDALAYNSLSLSILPSIDNPYLNDDHRKVLQLYRQSIFKEWA